MNPNELAKSLFLKGTCQTMKQAYRVANAIINKQRADNSKPLSPIFEEVKRRDIERIRVRESAYEYAEATLQGKNFTQGGCNLGEMADHYIDRQINQATNFGSPGRNPGRPGTSYNRHRNNSGNGSNYNPYMPVEDYNNLIRYLQQNFKYPKHVAERLVKEELIANGDMPIKPFENVNNQQRVSIVNMIAKAGLQIEGYENLDYKKALEEEKSNMYKADVKTFFKIENGEEDGEKILTIERGMNKDVVAVSYAHVHYRSKGFYAGRKSSVFAETNDTEKMLINMGEVFGSLRVLLNNLISADILTEDAYNNVMDGFEPFIFEALDYSEIEPMLGTTSGLKEGRKKRISNRKSMKVKK